MIPMVVGRELILIWERWWCGIIWLVWF